jgi:hypothetical protein
MTIILLIIFIIFLQEMPVIRTHPSKQADATNERKMTSFVQQEMQDLADCKRGLQPILMIYMIQQVFTIDRQDALSLE